MTPKYAIKWGVVWRVKLPRNKGTFTENMAYELRLLFTVSGTHPMVWPLPRPWSETMVSIPLWAQKTLEMKGFSGSGAPILDLVSQTPRPRGGGRPLFAESGRKLLYLQLDRFCLQLSFSADHAVSPDYISHRFMFKELSLVFFALWISTKNMAKLFVRNFGEIYIAPLGQITKQFRKNCIKWSSGNDLA